MRQPVIAFDLETGGLDPRRNAVLTCGMVTINLQGSLENPKYFIVHPPEDREIHPEALKKNKLSLSKHFADPDGLTYEKFGEEFLSYVTQTASRYGVRNVKLLGHNSMFDVEFMTYQIFGGVWPRRELGIASHVIDTMNLAAALAASRIDLPKLNLDACLKFYGLENPDAHNAFHDAVSAAKLFKKIMKV